MKVRATQIGYIYHERRRPGDVFELKDIEGVVRDKMGKPSKKVFKAEDQFSDKWMEKVSGSVPVSKEELFDDDVKPKKKKKKAVVESESEFSDDDVI